MDFQKGDIVKEVWKDINEIKYLLILNKLEPRGLVNDRYKIYDLGDGLTSDASLYNSHRAEYTLHFRPPKDKGK
jgi:hypothetical protein